MIGIGKWAGKVKALMMTFEGTVEVRNNNGQYAFHFELPERFKGVQIRTYDITEDGNTLRGKAEVSLLPGKELQAEVTFLGDTMEGRLIVPFMGNKEFKIIDGHRIAD